MDNKKNTSSHLFERTKAKHRISASDLAGIGAESTAKYRAVTYDNALLFTAGFDEFIESSVLSCFKGKCFPETLSTSGCIPGRILIG